jgi:hypothetical protein
MVEKVCEREGCEIMFKSHPSRFKKYCSKECRYSCTKYRDKQQLTHGTHHIKEADPVRRKGTCSICGPDTDIRVRTGTDRWRCKEQIRRLSRLQSYGLSVMDYEELIMSQGNKCAICLNVFVTQPHVDHDHNTGEIRGLLCRPCNTGLGLFKDSPEYLSQALAYIKKMW